MAIKGGTIVEKEIFEDSIVEQPAIEPALAIELGAIVLPKCSGGHCIGFQRGVGPEYGPHGVRVVKTVGKQKRVAASFPVSPEEILALIEGAKNGDFDRFISKSKQLSLQ